MGARLVEAGGADACAPGAVEAAIGPRTAALVPTFPRVTPAAVAYSEPMEPAGSRSTEIRRAILRHFAEFGTAPTPEDVGVTADEFAALAAMHAIVLRGDGSIAFANPFAAPPTDFEVDTPRGRRVAICAWDALGVLAALRQDGRVVSRCSDCGEEIVLEVRRGRLAETDTVAHFLVPAERWYVDLAYT